MVDQTDHVKHFGQTNPVPTKKERAREKLDKLIRYDEEQYCCGMRESIHGEYVMYDSVKRLIESL